LIEKPRAGEGFFNVEGPFPRMDNSRRWR
jgi:hypothetical protein